MKKSPNTELSELTRNLSNLKLDKKKSKKEVERKIENCINKLFHINHIVFEKIGFDYIKLYMMGHELKKPIQLTQKIASGSYGSIYQVKNKKAVVKKYHKNYKDESIIQENMIHIILHCIQPIIKKCFGHPISNCIPELYEYVGIPQHMTVMEQFEGTVRTLLNNKDFDTEKGFLIRLMYILYFLQSTTYFVHRDLHIENVLLKQTKQKTTKIFINNQNVTEITSNYEVYLIDFGFSCLSFNKCDIDLPDIVSGDFYQSKKCTNRSHDARLFLASLLFSHQKHLSQKLQNYIKNLLSRYTQLQNFKNFKVKSHFFYNDVINVDDKNFYPENIILNLIKL